MASTEEIFEIKESIEVGRYLIARKSIKRKELILKEAPIVVYPQVEEISEHGMPPKTICTSCYRSVDVSSMAECQLCKWPFCSVRCSQDTYHCTLECQLFASNSIMWSCEHKRLLYLVRAFILKTKDPDKWVQIMNLASTYGKMDAIINHKSIVETERAKTFLKKCKIEGSESEIKKLMAIFSINSFAFSVGTEVGSTVQGVKKYHCLYAQSSLFAHSCAPNVHYVALNRGTARWYICLYAVADIHEGAVLSIGYSDEYISKGTYERRTLLCKDFLFVCACSRCSDPTELSTFYSSVKCPQCQDGWLNPPTPSRELYTCNRCALFCMTPKDVEKMENKFRDEMKDIDRKTKSVQFEKLNGLISKATSSYSVHHNHFLVIEAIEKWLSVIDTNVLLESSPEIQATYRQIFKRAMQALTIRDSFGTHAQRVMLEAVIATAVVRFEFQFKQELPKIEESDNAKIKLTKMKTLITHLQDNIDREGSHLSDWEVSAFVERLIKKYHN